MPWVFTKTEFFWIIELFIDKLFYWKFCYHIPSIGKHSAFHVSVQSDCHLNGNASTPILFTDNCPFIAGYKLYENYPALFNITGSKLYVWRGIILFVCIRMNGMLYYKKRKGNRRKNPPGHIISFIITFKEFFEALAYRPYWYNFTTIWIFIILV